MLIVLDTNVLVSSFLKRDSNPAAILNAVVEGKIRLAVDERIFDEYNRVLHRPRLKIPPAQANPILQFIAFSSLWVQCQPVDFQQNQVNDIGDLPFAEVAICSRVQYLITGNKKHFTLLSGAGIKVLLPQEFLAEHRNIT